VNTRQVGITEQNKYIDCGHKIIIAFAGNNVVYSDLMEWQSFPVESNGDGIQ